jgi:hypothetical protein
MFNWVNFGKAKVERTDTMLIRSQVQGRKKFWNGSETRDRAKAVMSPRAPNPSLEGDEIVRTPGESQGVSINGSHLKTSMISGICVKYLGTTRRVTHVMSMVRQNLSVFKHLGGAA